MRLVELLQIAGALIGIPVTVFMAVEQRLLRRFLGAGATSAEAALELPALKPLLRWRLGQLEKSGAVVRVGPRRLFLDEDRYAAVRRRRAARGITIVLVILALVVLLHRLASGLAGPSATT